MRDPVVAILVLAGVVDGISGNPIHAVVLLTTAVALAWDAARGRGDGAAAADAAGTVQWSRSLGLLVVAGAASYAVMVGGFGRYSAPATLAVVAPGALAIVLAWRGPLRRVPDPGRLTPAGAAAWVSVFVAGALWELYQLLRQPTLTIGSYAHPTLSVLSDPLLASHPGRSIALFVWVMLGCYLLRR